MKRLFYPRLALAKFFAGFIFVSIFLCGITAKAQTYTISFPNAPPGTTDPSVNQNDLNGFGIEVGVRFRVTQIGTITGVRFYKGTSITGIHIGHLYDNAGNELAEATFTEPPATFGWLEVSFGTPVTVTPGNNYVASVFNDDGNYASENNTWADQGGADHGTDPIRVIAYSNDPGRNGIFVYTDIATGVFPTGDGTADNYWIDVRFDPTFTLPVNLSDLKATTTNNNVAVTWKTTSETNNSGFEIQRSNNNADWYAVGFVNGAGESTTVRNYSYTDKGLAPGLYYYRLKQNDHDGKSKISSVVSATVSGKGMISLFQNYPNPFSGITSIRYDLPKAQQIKLSVFDMMGREVKVIARKMSEAGSHLVSFDSKGLSRQMYSIRLKTESGVMTRQILVQ